MSEAKKQKSKKVKKQDSISTNNMADGSGMADKQQTDKKYGKEDNKFRKKWIEREKYNELEWTR